MTVQAALHSNWSPNGLPILTLIVPAPDGCDLACRGCFIKQRREEASIGHLGPFDYARFVYEVSVSRRVGAICIQGYEPLLQEAFPFTKEIISMGRQRGVPVSLVTNGTQLKTRASDLAKLQPAKIAVSLDAASPGLHDRLRGKEGAWDMTIAGLMAARRGLSSDTELCVASILRPNRLANLEAMPSLLQALGVRQWVITAFQRVGKGGRFGGVVGERRQLLQDVATLINLADQAGIDITVDDELGQLGSDDDIDNVIDLAAYRIRQVEATTGIFRLLPNGECSMGMDILRQVPGSTLCWYPGAMHAADFLERVQERAAS